jgi:DNA-binding phage protein
MLGVLRIVWERRLMVVIALVVAVGASVGFTLTSKGVYQSQASVLIPSADPLQSNVTKVSSIASELESYAKSGLRKGVDKTLGSEGDGLVSVVAAPQRDLDTYVITATARSRTVAQAAAEEATTELINKSKTLGQAQVASLRARVQTALEPFNDQRAPLAARRLDQAEQVKVLQRDLELAQGTAQESTIANQLLQAQIDLDHTTNALAVIDDQRDGLINLLQDASVAQLSREAVAKVLSHPSTPSSNLAGRLVQAIGLGIIVGLTVPSLLLLWLERARLSPTLPERPREGVVESKPSASQDPVAHAHRSIEDALDELRTHS